MKPVLVVVIFLTGFSTLSALTDKCEENNLNALMVHFRKFHTDFKQFKEIYETQKNTSLKELKALQNVTNQLKETTKEMKSDNKQKTEEIQKLNEKLQNMTERLTELTVEKQTTPLVSFVVRLTGEHNCTEKLPFGLVLLNEGDGFDNTSNSFIAPYSGFYSLTAQLCIYDYSYSFVYFQFSIYSQTYNKTYGAITYENYYYYNYDCKSLTAVAKLESEEEVYVRTKCPYQDSIVGNIGDTAWTMFTGILIHLSP